MQKLDHNETVRQAFTRQAVAYAAAPSIADPSRVGRLVRAVNAAPEARVIEIAMGPGHVALGFALACREVVGIDLTEAPLAIAEQARRERGLTNVRFQLGDATQLPFLDGEFDVVVCRFAFHHFDRPERVLAEMKRVCRPLGSIAIEDLIVSEHPQRAAYQNRFENLRDDSHTRAFTLTALVAMVAAGAVEIEHVSTDELVPELENWLQRAQTPPDRAAEARRLIERDEAEDLSGTRPFRQEGKRYFHQRTAIVVGRKLSAA
ncbi:MAG: class I SAM-dependent methyltransferase [Dehalococcoidia bacterium]